MVARTCEICNTGFNVVPAVVARGGGRFCSRVCSTKGRTTRVTRNCEQCGTVMEVERNVVESGHGRFCSRACKGKWASINLTGADAAHWRGGPATHTCETCGKEFPVGRGNPG